jgi:murein L,D-transpeptidase YcbB/YkuD
MKIVAVILCWMTMLFGLVPFTYGQRNSISTELSGQLREPSGQSKLYYPKSVKRLYQQNGFQPLWIKNKEEAKQTWEAMMLLDCVLQFGLSHADYHPHDLIYDKLRTMINEPGGIGIGAQARFDILLTDALITLVNHLYYGKLNPYFSRKRIDGLTKATEFNAVVELIKARQEPDFITAILTVQPKSKAYADLQSYMRLIKGQYVGDCYETPESEVRKIAINMERLRWAESYTKQTGHKKVPYLTCEIKDGLPVFHEDIHHLDEPLEAAMYPGIKSKPLKGKELPFPDIRIKKE